MDFLDGAAGDQLVLPPFTVTQAAIEAITALSSSCPDDPTDPTVGVRVDLADGGCCGTTWTFSLVGRGTPAAPDHTPESPDIPGTPDDLSYGCPGAWLHVSPRAHALLRGAVLDHGPTLRPPRFRVLRNPNTPHTCACRRSFGKPWLGPGQPSCRSYCPMPWDDDFRPPLAWLRQTGRLDKPGEAVRAARVAPDAP